MKRVQGDDPCVVEVSLRNDRRDATRYFFSFPSRGNEEKRCTKIEVLFQLRESIIDEIAVSAISRERIAISPTAPRFARIVHARTISRPSKFYFFILHPRRLLSVRPIIESRRGARDRSSIGISRSDVSARVGKSDREMAIQKYRIVV